MERLTGSGEQLSEMLNNKATQLQVYLQLKKYEDMFESLGVKPAELHKIVRGYKIRGQILKAQSIFEEVKA